MLLQAAANSKFDAMLRIDKKMEYEQNLKSLPLTNALEGLAPFVRPLHNLFESQLEKILYAISIDGKIEAITEPRPKI